MNRYILVFFIFSFGGWVWESIYCTMCDKKWANRGFLYGPVCPIYGAGGILGLITLDLISHGTIPNLSATQTFFAGFVASMILEYPTSLILEKLFCARWWDYSRLPLNINGRTSVPTSIAFGGASIFILKCILPPISDFISVLPLWTVNLAVIVLTAVISADITLTVSALTDFQKRVESIDTNFQNHMTDAVEQIYSLQSGVHKHTIKRIKLFKFDRHRSDIANKIKSFL